MLIVVLMVTLGLGIFVYLKNRTPAPVAAAPVVLPVLESHVTPASPREGVVKTGTSPSREIAPVVTVTPVQGPAVKPVRTVGNPVAVVAQDTTAKPTSDKHAAPPTAPAGQTEAVSSTAVLAKARTQIASGDLLPARDALNAALASGSLNATDSAETRKLISDVSQIVYFSPKRFENDPVGGTYTVASGDNLAKIGAKYEITAGFLQRLNGISDPKKLRAGQTIKIVKGPFHAVVNKQDFTLDVYLGAPRERGSLFVTQLKVGLGKDDSTPTGVWAVKAGGKLKNPKFWGAGGLKPMDADDPQNPLGEYWIAMAGMDGAAVGKDGYGIHGTIDPASIGTQASLGCIRLKDEDISLVYDLLVDGKSTVTVSP